MVMVFRSLEKFAPKIILTLGVGVEYIWTKSNHSIGLEFNSQIITFEDGRRGV